MLRDRQPPNVFWLLAGVALSALVGVSIVSCIPESSARPDVSPSALSETPQPSDTPRSEEPPRAVATPSEIDFGSVIRGESASATVLVSNPSSEPLVIERVHSSCGCTVAEPSDRTIPALGSTELAISMRPGGHHGTTVTKRVEIVLDSGPPLHVAVSATVYDPIVVGSHRSGDAVTVLLESTAGIPFSIDRIEPDSFADLDERKALVTHVLTRPGLATAPESAVVYTDHPHAPEVHINIAQSGEQRPRAKTSRRPRLRLSESLFRLGVLERDEERTITFYIRDTLLTSGNPQVTVPDSLRLNVESSARQAGPAIQLDLTFTPIRNASGLVDAGIVVQQSDARATLRITATIPE